MTSAVETMSLSKARIDKFKHVIFINEGGDVPLSAGFLILRQIKFTCSMPFLPSGFFIWFVIP